MPPSPELQTRLRRLLAHRQDYQQAIRTLGQKHEFVVFYGCGAILKSIIETWDACVGRKIDFCCDSDPAKWGQLYCGIRCIAPQELQALRNRCTVFVTVGDFKPVVDFLIDRGFPSVHLIYKYDLVAADFLNRQNPDGIVADLCACHERLADQASREVFAAIVERVLGDGNDVEVMARVCRPDQYFPRDIVTLGEHECFVDVGAYNGDTVGAFLQHVHERFDRIDAFEVDQANFELLQNTVKKMANRERICLHNLGIWDSECDIRYSVGNSQSTVGEGEGHGRVVPLDAVLARERVSFLKMDIEGAELRALHGAAHTIRTQKPKLAICVYHEFRHLWEIPLYIKELVPEYRIYLRHHTKLEYETVCYAVL